MKNILYIFFSVLFLISCSDNDPLQNTGNNQEEYGWSVPKEKIRGSFNPFPLVLDPDMIKTKNINFILEDSRIALISFNDEIRAYPYEFVSKYEAVNDRIGNMEYTLSFCPITKSGIAFDRNFSNKKLILKASGYLYQENQVLYDEKTDSYWSQMLLQSIKGVYSGKKPATFHHVELPWKMVKTYFPEALVFTRESIDNKPEPDKKEVPEKSELFYGFLNKNLNPKSDVNISIYRFQSFSKATVLKKKFIQNKELLIIGNSDEHFITSYINNIKADFTAVQNQFPVVMKDDLGNLWNLFGKAVSGPDKGKQLESPTDFFALLWAWEDFYDHIIIEE